VPSKQFNKKSTAARNFIQQRRRTSALSAKRHKVKLTPLMFSPLQQLFSLFSSEQQWRWTRELSDCSQKCALILFIPRDRSVGARA
jgi:hypothetical protein